MKGLSVLLGLFLTVFASPIVAHATSLRVVLVRWEKFRQTAPIQSNEPLCVNTDGQPSSCSPAFEICLLNSFPNRRCTQTSRFGGYLTPYRLKRTIFFRSRLPGGLKNPMRFLVEKQEAVPVLLLSVTNVDFKPGNLLAKFLIKIPWPPYDVDVAEKDAKWKSYELFNKHSKITIDLSIKVFTLNYRCGAACQAAKLWDKVQPIWRRTIQGRMRFKMNKREHGRKEANKKQKQTIENSEKMKETANELREKMKKEMDQREAKHGNAYARNIKESVIGQREKENEKESKNQETESGKKGGKKKKEEEETKGTSRRWKRTLKQEEVEKEQEEIKQKNKTQGREQQRNSPNTKTRITPEQDASETTSRTQKNTTTTTNPTTTTADMQTKLPNQTLTTERNATTTSIVVPTTNTTSAKSVTSTTTNTDQTQTTSSAVTTTTTNTPTSVTPHSSASRELSSSVPTTSSISSTLNVSPSSLVSSHTSPVGSDAPDVFVDIVSVNSTTSTVAASLSTLPLRPTSTPSDYSISYRSSESSLYSKGTTTNSARAISTLHSDVSPVLRTTTASSRKDRRTVPLSKVSFYLIALLLTVSVFSFCVPCVYLLCLRRRFVNRFLFF